MAEDQEVFPKIVIRPEGTAEAWGDATPQVADLRVAGGTLLTFIGARQS